MNKDNLQVFHTIMSKAHHMDTITAEMSQYSNLLPRGNSEIERRMVSDMERVKEVSEQLVEEIKKAGALNKVQHPRERTALWRLFSGTAWPITTIRAQLLKRLCAVALEETTGDVLGARRKTLHMRQTMDLRFSMWLEVNLWLRWNSGKHVEFTWWDQCPDQPGTMEMVYQGEAATRISNLFREDTEILKELGDMLTKCKALVNNRNAPPSARVLSLEAKEAIDKILQVSPDILGRVYSC